MSSYETSVANQKLSKIELTYIGEKIYDVGCHVVFVKNITYNGYKGGSIQKNMSGYRLVTFNSDSSLINNNWAVYENTDPVKVKVYKTKAGNEISPDFGIPLI